MQIERERAAATLENARKKAVSYSSSRTRAKMVEGLARCGTGMVPYVWQLDVAEALLLGLDCSVIAGTGAGKTMPFILPLFVETHKIIIIISPLDALEEDQASRFRSMGFSAAAVNGTTYSETLRKEIENKKHQVIITSPEMCLEHDGFRRLLNSPEFAAQICAIVIDEAHCIAQWGSQFRPLYAQLGTLRAFVSLKIPFLVTSATLPPPVLAQVRMTMHIQKDTSYHVNLGTDRPNIAWFVKNMTGAASDLESLGHLLLPANADDELTSTMVFFDSIDVALSAFKWLQEHLPAHQHDKIAIYNSRRAPLSKRIKLRDFRRGKIKILLTTEAAGMGCDIPHVERVIQFMVPDNLSIWMQRAGRAGRNRNINAQAILLVQPSVFQEVKKAKTSTTSKKKSKHMPEDPDALNYRKNIEEGLRKWIETEGCRREISDEYFGDKGSRTAPTGICCDNCLRKTQPEHPLLVAVIPPNAASPVENELPEVQTGSTLNENGKRTSEPSQPNRRDAHLLGARKLLEDWRNTTWRTLYARRPWGPQCLLPDAVLTAIATKARYCSATIEELVDDSGWSGVHGQRHGQELIDMLTKYDKAHHTKTSVEKMERVEKRKAETLERKRAKQEADKAERERLRAIAKTLPKPPRPSRAKKAVLGSTSTMNVSTPPPSSSYYPIPGPSRGNENIPPSYNPLPRHSNLPPPSSTSILPSSPLPYHMSYTSQLAFTSPLLSTPYRNTTSQPTFNYAHSPYLTSPSPYNVTQIVPGSVTYPHSPSPFIYNAISPFPSEKPPPP